MINGIKIIAIIPARGGSKGLPNKNMQTIAGQSLLAWTILAARDSQYLDYVIVSSDSDTIIEEARQFDCEAPFKRPDALSLDTTPGIEPVLHALEQLPGYDVVVLLQPTSPLRTAEDIDAALTLLLEKKANACVSVVAEKAKPQWMFTLNDHYQLEPITNGNMICLRQDLAPIYQLNGAVYIANVAWLKQTKTFITDETIAYVMPKERSIDIDNHIDLKLAELIVKEIRGSGPL